MVPFPDVLTRIAYLSLIIIVVVVPVVIERFTMSPVMTPMLTLFAVFLFLSIHCISIQLESPYGEDYVDLPLLEMHMAFNNSLLVFGELGPNPMSFVSTTSSANGEAISPASGGAAGATTLEF